MHMTRLSLICLLAIGAIAFASCGKSPELAPDKPIKTATPTPAKDEDLIQGKWICVEYSEDGVKAPGGGGIRAVFTAKEVKIGTDQEATVYQYRLLGGDGPKRCDLVFHDTTRHLAYQLQNDILTLASHREEDQDKPAPKSLEPAPGLSISKFRRAEQIPAPADATKTGKPAAAEEELALTVLRQQLTTFRELFEKKKYEEILDEMIAPHVRRKLQESPEEKALFLGRMKMLGESFAKLLAAVENQRPVFNASRTRASFDIRLIHFDGFPGMPQLQFQREGDSWFMSDR